jgi:DNA-binding transcriptional MerR regulator
VHDARVAEAGAERALRIGEVAALTGVSVDTLRYYERQALIPPPRRRSSGYRAYSGAVVRRVRAIKWAQSLGFRLQEIPALLEGAHGHRPGPAARAAILLKRREVSGRLRRLRTIRDTLEKLAVCRCVGVCPLVERALDHEPSHGRRDRAVTRQR